MTPLNRSRWSPKPPSLAVPGARSESCWTLSGSPRATSAVAEIVPDAPAGEPRVGRRRTHQQQSRDHPRNGRFLVAMRARSATWWSASSGKAGLSAGSCRNQGRRRRSRPSTCSSGPARRSLGQADEQPAVTLTIAKRPGANAISVADEVLKKVETLKGQDHPQ